MQIGFSAFVRALVALAAAALGGAAALWWLSGVWTPPRDRYPVQGVALSANNGEIEWPALHRQGVDFVYLAATTGANARDPRFAANWQGAQVAGLRYGAIHGYSLCAAASEQARQFIASVPRDNGALPPVVSLDMDAGCVKHPGRDEVLANLNSFLAEIEAHSGKTAILRISKQFETAYAVSEGVNRTIWLEGDILPPHYASHSWVMWTANRWKRLRGADGKVEWTVVRP